MKILYIANSRLPTEKAHGFQIVKMVEVFQGQGAEVSLFLPKRRNPISSTVGEFYGLDFRPTTFYAKNYFGFLESSFHRPYFIFQRFFFAWQAFFFAISSDADFIFTREITISFFLSILGKKVVFEDHEPKKRLRAVYGFFIKGIWKKIIVAEKLAELYEKFGVDRDSYIVAPNGVDLKEFDSVNPDREIWKQLGLAGNEKIVLYVGHFYRWKGVYTLLDAAEFLEGAKIVLIGGTETDRLTVLKYVDGKNLRNVLVRPFVPHKDIIKFIKSADVLVLPNTAEEERSARYTTPIKLFEYMASGVPIVASDLPSFASYLNQKNSFLVPADKPSELGKTIARALRDECSREKTRLAYQDVRCLTWDNRAKKILGFLAK